MHAPDSPLDTLLAQAAEAMLRGDRQRARQLARQMLDDDGDNEQAVSLLEAACGDGELRQLTIMFSDLVGSTELSGALDVEHYRTLISKYKEVCRAVIEDRYDGHVLAVRGDGLLAAFGHPVAHEDDAVRAVRAGLDLLDEIEALSGRVDDALGHRLAARVAVHSGRVFLDRDEDEIYGLAANVAARLQELADPGTVLVSDSILDLVGGHFELAAQPPRPVKGLAVPLRSHVVIGPVAQPPRHVERTPLVGRHAEMTRIRAAWSEAAGSTRTVVLRGEPGIGKTRLVHVVADELASVGVPVVELGGSPLRTHSGLHPVRTLIERSCGIEHQRLSGERRLNALRNEVTHRGLSDDHLAHLAVLLGISGTAGYAPPESEGRKLLEGIRDAVLSYLAARFGPAPGLLVVEDLHWVDESTWSLVSDHMRRLNGGMLLATIRSGQDPVVGADADVIDLRPLDEDDVRTLARAVAPHALDDNEMSEVVRRSDGVPLFVEHLASAGPLIAGDMAPPTSTIPAPLYEPLVARLQATPGGVAVAGTAAAIGREVDRDFLRRVVEPAVPEFETTVGALVDLGIFERRARGYRFLHELLRDLAYELQPVSRRRDIHLRVARAMLADTGDDDADDDDAGDWIAIASHFTLAGEITGAADAYESAADVARRRGDLREARLRLGEAIDLIVRSPQAGRLASREAELRLRRGFLAVTVEGNASRQAADDFERCLELTLADPRGDEMFATFVALWGYYTSRADLHRSREVLEALRATLLDDRTRFRPANEAGFGMVDWFEGRFGASRERLEAAHAAMSTGTDYAIETWWLPNDPMTSIHTHLAMARYVGGDTVGADAQFDEAGARAASIDFPQGPFSYCYALVLRGWSLVERGDLRAAELVATELIGTAERHGFDSWLLVASTLRTAVAGLHAINRGSEDARAAAEHAHALDAYLSMWRALDIGAYFSYYLTISGTLHARGGEGEAARAAFAEAGSHSRTTGMTFYDAETMRAQAHLIDDCSVRIEALRAAHALAIDQGAAVFALRSALDLAEADADPGLAMVSASVDRHQPNARTADLDRARRLLAS
ncbi:MAG TPA: AAA family ATPase [Acidimicrobiales bacterium]